MISRVEAEEWWRHLEKVERVRVFVRPDVPDRRIASKVLAARSFSTLPEVVQKVIETAYVNRQNNPKAPETDHGEPCTPSPL
jgi:hypothetical protein